MICPKCGANMTLRKGRCDKCGFDIEVNQKTRKYSCYYYNRGLERAKIRDLSGAVDMLRRALKISKKNVDARNLLGLVYFEMGETVEALREWIISKNILEENNPAERYLAALQANPAKLDNLNQAIRKYNAALDLAMNGGDDLALIQLKKCVALHPKFLRAWQLLALVYMRNDDTERARRCLKRTLAIDIANTDSIRYLKEIRLMHQAGRQIQIVLSEPESEEASKPMGGKAKTSLLPHFGYEEDRPDYRVFLSLVAGIFLGIVTVFFLMVPGVREGMRQEFREQQIAYGEELSAYLADIDTLEKENQALQSRVEISDLELEELRDELEGLSTEVNSLNFFSVLTYYLDLKENGNPSDMQKFLLRKRLEKVQPGEIRSAVARALYERMQQDFGGVTETTVPSADLYAVGVEYYRDGAYATAIEYFEYAYGLTPDNESNLYYMARTYHLLEQNETAMQYYREYLDRFPNGEYSVTVADWLNELAQ